MDIYEELNQKKLNSFAFDYNNYIKQKFDWEKIDKKYSYKQLKKGYNDFMQFLKRINDLSQQYFDAILEEEQKHDNKSYFDLSFVYISEIQNIYLNPINNRQNQMKANWSILTGIVSIIAGIVSIIAGFLIALYF